MVEFTTGELPAVKHSPCGSAIGFPVFCLRIPASIVALISPRRAIFRDTPRCATGINREEEAMRTVLRAHGADL